MVKIVLTCLSIFFMISQYQIFHLLTLCFWGPICPVNDYKFKKGDKIMMINIVKKSKRIALFSAVLLFFCYRLPLSLQTTPDMWHPLKVKRMPSSMLKA